MDRMRVEGRSIDSGELFRILLDSFPDMIHSVDEDGRIVFANRTAETLLGYSRAELLGMDVRQIYADEVREAMEAGFRALKREGGKRVESQLKARDGTRIPVEIRSFGIYDDAGRFLKTFSILRDIRQLKELQNGLVHAGRLAAIGEMASGVAHDIHNPLTVILLANEMIERTLTRGKGTPVESLETVRHYAGDIDKAADSIKKLADHLRDFSRGMVQAHERLDLYDAVADALFITQNRICKCSVTAVNRVVKGRHWTMGCPNQIEQVFVNLIANACDAMEGRPRRDLEISIEPHEADGRPYWRCCVSDTGPGVPPELRDAIFRSFFTTKPRGKGTGLGLSICGSIVREHKGEISLATGDGAGSRFLVDLPQA